MGKERNKTLRILLYLKKSIKDRIVKDRIIRDIWTLYKTEESKKERKKLEKRKKT